MSEMMVNHVVVVSGGLGHEREVSLRSGVRVANTLRSKGIKVDVIDFDKNLFDNLSSLSPQVVFPVVHGMLGEGGALQNLLTSTGIPYVGTTGTYARVAADKATAKAVMINAGLKVPRCFSYSRQLFQQIGAHVILEKLISNMPFPVVVKPARGGSGLGVSVVTNMTALKEAMVSALSYDDQVMIEEFIDGIDVSISIFDSGANSLLPQKNQQDSACKSESLPDVELFNGLEVLPAIEISYEGQYDYDARYNAGRAEYFIPARMDQKTLNRVNQDACKAHKALNLRHLSRIDTVVDNNGEPWIIDANVLPGMTDTSLWPQAANAAAEDGFSKKLCDLVNLAAASS